MKAQITLTFEVEDQYEINEIQAEIENALYSIDTKIDIEDAYILNEYNEDEEDYEC